MLPEKDMADRIRSSSDIADERVIPVMGMTGDQYEHAASAVVRNIKKYYDSLQNRNVLPSVTPGYLQGLLPQEAPVSGEAWETINADIEKVILPGVTHWQSPNYMAYFPASSTYPAMLGDMWSSALTAPAFNWICSPVVTELETIVMDWLAKALHLPSSFLSNAEGGGVIQGSASEAAATVAIAARERIINRILSREGVTSLPESEDRACQLRSTLVALGSDQAHSSSKKAAIIAGTRYRSISTRAEDGYALTGKNLRETLEEAEKSGYKPYFLMVSLGTTNTCAVDDLLSISGVMKDYPDVWIHCDAAYAGASLILPEYKHLAVQMELVDSFTVNMHKWLLTNFDASPLFVRKRRDLTDTLGLTPAYLRNNYTDSGLVTDYRDWQIPLGRRFRSLKIWFVMRTWGIRGMQNHIRYHIDLGLYFVSLVKSRADLFRILTRPAFALTVITICPILTQAEAEGKCEVTDGIPSKGIKQNELDIQATNVVTKKVYDLITERKLFFLTATEIQSIYAIRIVSANPLANTAAVDNLFNELVSTAEEVLQTSRSSSRGGNNP